jgi:hypothetical protein
MHQVDHHLIARTDQHARPIDAAACASKYLWNAADSLLADVTSEVSGWCVRLVSPRSAPRRTATLVLAWEAPDAAC